MPGTQQEDCACKPWQYYSSETRRLGTRQQSPHTAHSERPNPLPSPQSALCQHGLVLPLQALTFTFRTSLAWNSGVQLWWMNPIPPVSWRHKGGCELPQTLPGAAPAGCSSGAGTDGAPGSASPRGAAGPRGSHAGASGPASPVRAAQGTRPHGAALTAMAMAMLASVTVSMGEETSGVFRVILLVSAEVRSWRGGRRRRRVSGGTGATPGPAPGPLPRPGHSPPGPP